MKKATILMVHGSRVQATTDELNLIVEKLQKLSDGSKGYFSAYMELQEPSLEEALTDIKAQGFSDIEVLPLFILAGKHVRKDIPAQVKAAQLKFPELRITLQPHIGSQDNFLSLILS